MPTLITARRLRIAADLFSLEGPVDKASQGAPDIWRANYVRIEMLFTVGEALVSDFSNQASLTVRLSKLNAEKDGPDDTAEALASVVVSEFNAGCTAEAWKADTDQHAVAEFTAAQLNHDPAECWLSATFLTTDAPARAITAFAGKVRLRATGYDPASPPPPVDGSGYTRDEADARFMPIAAPGFRFADGYWQLRDVETAGWRGAFLDGGVLTWTDENPPASESGDFYRVSGSYLQLRDALTDGWRSVFLENGVLTFGDEESV